MDSNHLNILRHALGTGDDGAGTPYRNHFVTGEGSADHAACMALVDSGHMTRRNGSPLTGGDDLFLVTDAGRAALAPPPKVSRARHRYRQYLDADSCLTFGQWLRQGGRDDG